MKSALLLTTTALLLLAPRISYGDALLRGVEPTLTLVGPDQNYQVSGETLAQWRQPATVPANNFLIHSPTGTATLMANFLGQLLPAPEQATITYPVDAQAIYNYVANLAQQIDHPPVEPQLTIAGNRASDFVPPEDGRTTDIYDTTLSIIQSLDDNATSVPLIVSTTSPQQTLTELNNLGISELIGEGVSTFKGSPNNRRHNIAVGIKTMNGLLIGPGQTFSFDNALGPVTAAQGYLPELVILSNETVPEDGGGLCQVSTTMFRAAMAAGLPITDRKNHAYAVSYYSPQGTDATIYPGSADLKFVNDTPGTILVSAYEKDSNTAVFDFYGTYDGRQTTLEKPVVYDRKADGSMKATWTRLVEKDGQTRTDVLSSNYLPPALFHETETFVSATGTPEAARSQ